MALKVKLHEVRIPEEIRKAPELASAVGRADEVLSLYAPPSGVHVTANWELSYDEQRHPVFDLGLHDKWEANASARFTLDELNDQQTLERRLNWLWGDLLQDRSHKQIEELKRYSEPVGGS